MRISIDAKNKKTDIEGDVESIAEKIIDNSEKDWKLKFDTKHNARKEMMEIRHKHKMEIDEKNQKKRNWIQKIQDEKLKAKELELEEKRRQEKMKTIKLVMKIVGTCILCIIAAIMLIMGIVLGVESGDSDSGWYALSAIGMIPLYGIVTIWTIHSNDNTKKRK